LQQIYRLVENSAYDQLPLLLKERIHD